MSCHAKIGIFAIIHYVITLLMFAFVVPNKSSAAVALYFWESGVSRSENDTLRATVMIIARLTHVLYPSLLAFPMVMLWLLLLL
jgi:hypothetical protein